MPAAYAEAGPWTVAQPGRAASDQPWWTLYNDAELDALVARADASSPGLQVAAAQVRQAQALLALALASRAPTLGASLAAGRSRTQASSGPLTQDTRALGLAASWEPDLWGRLQQGVQASRAAAEASADDLAAALLSLQATLVQAYMGLRVADAQAQLQARTVQALTQALALTRHQQQAGVAGQADVALAESTLQSARAQAADLALQRSQLAHAVAVLAGRAPAQLTIAPRPDGTIGLALPATPPGLPSQLLERRPDIAAAERRAAAANAALGEARAAAFPSLTLGASAGYASNRFAPWLAAPSSVWALGATLAGALLDGGARTAQTAAARAADDAAAAQYKQRVLAALQEVEDALAAQRLLAQEQRAQAAALAAARVAARISLAQYRAGTGGYLAVLTTQNAALASERNDLALQGRRLLASAALVTALGGGWSAAAPTLPAGPPAGPAPPSTLP